MLVVGVGSRHGRQAKISTMLQRVVKSHDKDVGHPHDAAVSLSLSWTPRFGVAPTLRRTTVSQKGLRTKNVGQSF